MSFSLNFYCPAAASCQSSVIFEAAQTRSEVSLTVTDMILHLNALSASKNTYSNEEV